MLLTIKQSNTGENITSLETVTKQLINMVLLQYLQLVEAPTISLSLFRTENRRISQNLCVCGFSVLYCETI